MSRYGFTFPASVLNERKNETSHGRTFFRVLCVKGLSAKELELPSARPFCFTAHFQLPSFCHTEKERKIQAHDHESLDCLFCPSSVRHGRLYSPPSAHNSRSQRITTDSPCHHCSRSTTRTRQARSSQIPLCQGSRMCLFRFGIPR